MREDSIIDLFVFGAKCDGVYVEVDTASGAGTVCATPTLASKALSSATSGATVMYTVDGSDPRYSISAKVASGALTEATGTKVRAYAYKDGAFPSEVFEGTL